MTKPSQRTKGDWSSWRWVGFIVSLALLAAAAWAVHGQWSSLSEAVGAARGARLWLVVLAVALPVLNWLLTGGVFYFLMLPRAAVVVEDAPGVPRQVSLTEMMLLIGSAWLLNYLPLSPGMIGRVAYHRAVHRIPVMASVGVLVAAVAIGLGVALVVLALVVLNMDAQPSTYLWILGAPAPLLLVPGWIGAVGGQRRGAWRYAAAAGLRWLDFLVWMARYWVVFNLLGRQLTLPQAAAIAAASQVAMQVPLVGNGLGVREWAVGLVGPVLPPFMNAGAGGLSRGLGLSADLLNRGFELVAALPVGILCTVTLMRKHAEQRRNNG
jgi:hypothetical protein